MVDNDQVCDTGHGVPAPLWSLLNSKSSKKTGQDHDDISDNGNEDIGTAKTGEEAQVKKEKWGSETPVNIAGPVDFAVDGLEGVWVVLLGLLDGDLVVANTIVDSHAEI